jgi:DTW domain-containing protein YfiP
MTVFTDYPDPPDPEEYCPQCGENADNCVCPECPICGSAGDPVCYAEHGMTLSPEQFAHKAAADLRIATAEATDWERYEEDRGQDSEIEGTNSG